MTMGDDGVAVVNSCSPAGSSSALQRTRQRQQRKQHWSPWKRHHRLTSLPSFFSSFFRVCFRRVIVVTVSQSTDCFICRIFVAIREVSVTSFCLQMLPSPCWRCTKCNAANLHMLVQCCLHQPKYTVRIIVA